MHFFYRVGGFQKSYVIFGGGMSKYLLFLTGVGGWSEKGPKYLWYDRNFNLLKIFPLTAAQLGNDAVSNVSG